MLLSKQLSGGLSEIDNLIFRCLTSQGVRHKLQVDRTLVSQVVKHVVVLLGFLALLAAAEYQVYPLVYIRVSVVGFQRLLVYANEIVR